MMEQSQRELSHGVTLTAIQSDRFKTSLLAFTFLEPLSKETATENALLPTLLRRGCEKYPDMFSMAAALDELYGAVLEPILRKKGETQCLGFVGSFLDEAYLPQSAGFLEETVDLMAEVLLHPAQEDGAFVSAYLESETENLRQRMRSRLNDKQQYAFYRLSSQMCQGEAYGVDKLGDEADLALVTKESLWTRYQSLLSSAPLALFYCGSAPLERVEAALRTALSPLLSNTRNASLPQTTNTIQPTQEVRYFEEEMDVTQGKLVLGFRLPKPCIALQDSATLQVLNALYGGSTNAKLFLQVREKLSLCYYANSMPEKYKGLLFVSSGIAFDQYERARDEILAQLDDCRKGVFSEEDLENARRFVGNSLRLTRDSQGRLEDFWLGQAVAGRTDEPVALEQAVLAVRKEEIQTLAQALRLDSVYFLKGKE